MRNVMRLLAAGAIAAATAACVGDTGYYGNSYGYPSSSYTYPSQAYYPSSSYSSGYVYNPAPRRPS